MAHAMELGMEAGYSGWHPVAAAARWTSNNPLMEASTHDLETESTAIASQRH
jgi:hypothetical protein